MLLQIIDQAWKDHLHAMDNVKQSVGLRGYAEKDPRIEYKREGANQYAEMQTTVRDRVTELIFRAKLTPNVQAQSAYGAQQQASHPAAQTQAPAPAQAAQPLPHMTAGAAAPAQAPAPGSEEQQRDLAAAEQAGGQPQANRPGMSRKQRRAAEARERKGKGGGGGGSKQRKRRR